MASPNPNANTRIGMKPSMPPVELNPSNDSPLPSWNTQTSTPSEAPREITFMINALIGISTDPVMKNSSTNVASMTSPRARRVRWAASR